MSDRILTFDEVVSLMQALALSSEMIAIDGAPLAGKSTLAERLVAEFGFGLMIIDDFVRAEEEWSGARPSYPYPYFRNDDFANALRALRDEGQCFYYPYDWATGFVSSVPRHVVRDKPLVIEGNSVLDLALVDLYDLRFFIESDPATLWDARGARDGDEWAHHWRDLFLPSVDLYAESKPKTRADYLVKGRGM